MSTSPVVEVTSGNVRGSRSDDICSFKGIPYASSTGGSRRFKPPSAVTPWSGIRNTTVCGNSPPQVIAAPHPLFAWYSTVPPIDEDCLFVNVFTPALNVAARRPVMVWIHGGAWANGAGSAPGFDGTNLAKLGDVVVVTVNHRLNVFGYLRLDDPDERFADSGNVGMLDLVAALQWVRDNVAAFGGDPANVTIFGQSGGAAKVTGLMAMPAARGLFHKAIAQSCSGVLRLASEEEAARLTHGLAARLGIEHPTGTVLQAVPVEQMVASLATLGWWPFRPVLDGRSFTRNPFDPLAPEIASDIPLMIGTVATEATRYMAVDSSNFTLGIEEVRRRVGRFLGIGADQTERVLDTYRIHLSGPLPSELMAAVATDYTYGRNTTRAAALQAATARAPVYAYMFNWKAPAMDGVLKTPHTIEVPFVFGTTEGAQALLGSGPEVATLARTMIATWSAFARSGNPNNPALPHWQRYHDIGRSTMVFDNESKIAPDPGGEARRALDPLPYFEYSMPSNYVRA